MIIQKVSNIFLTLLGKVFFPSESKNADLKMYSFIQKVEQLHDEVEICPDALYLQTSGKSIDKLMINHKSKKEST